MNPSKLSPLPLVLTLTAVTLAGCSFSKSSESSSDSSKSVFDMTSSPFKSSSSSDSSASDQEKFENDVADYTNEFVTSSIGTLDNFREHLSEIAQDHGVTNWEGDRTTYLGIGRGLKKAKLGKPQVSAFTESLSGNDPMKKQAIEDGLKK